jgi:NADPH-dependent ferric siderophore reductase
VTAASDARAAELARIRTFITSVTAVEPVGAHMVQVTCGGGDLSHYEPLGPDDFVYVLAPPRGCAHLSIDRSFTWSAYERMPESRRPVGAYYTVRRWRPADAAVDLVIVTHGDGDDAGEGSRWAQRARPGDPVALWGPRRVYDPPSRTSRFLLVADETGVHAIAAILESLPEDVRADVVVEGDRPDDDVPLAVRPNVCVTRLHRNGAPPGTTSLLADAVRALPAPGPDTYAWGGAESKAMTAIRRYLRDDCGLEQDAVAMTAYWRRDPR